MKQYKQILEAIQRGINLALDDYEDDENNEPISSKANIVKNYDYVHKRLRFNELISKFEKQLDAENVIYVGEKHLKEIAQLSKELGIKYKPDINNNKRTLTYIIRSICKSDIRADLNWIDTSEETSFFNLFNMTLFHGDISEWDTHNVKNMYSCFAYSQFNGDISRWDVSNVENMDWMFQGSWFNKPIDTWDVSNVTSMNGMFSESHFNQNISKWNVTNCKNYIKFNNESTLKKSNMPPKFRK